MYYFLMNIGQRLKRMRKSAGLTQNAVGAAFSSPEKPEGLGKQAISHWENNVNQLTVPQVVTLCGLYGVSADEILLGTKPNLTFNELNGLEGQLVTLYRQLNEGKQGDLLEVINQLVNDEHPGERTINNPYPHDKRPKRRELDILLSKSKLMAEMK